MKATSAPTNWRTKAVPIKPESNFKKTVHEKHERHETRQHPVLKFIHALVNRHPSLRAEYFVPFVFFVDRLIF